VENNTLLYMHRVKSRKIRSRKMLKCKKNRKRGGNLTHKYYQARNAMRQTANMGIQRLGDFSSRITFTDKQVAYYINKLESIHLRHDLIVDYLKTLDTSETDEPFDPPFDDFRLFIRRISYKKNCQKNIIYHDPLCKQISDLFHYLNKMYNMNSHE